MTLPFKHNLRLATIAKYTMVLICDHLYGSLSKYYNIETKCNNLIWKIHDNPSQLNNDELNNVIVQENNTVNKRYMAMPISFNNYGIVMLTNDEYTLGDLLKLIYNFYKDTEVSYSQLKLFSENVEIFEACKEMKNNGIDSIKLENIIGSPRYFQGFDIATDLSDDIQYTVLLGS